MKDFSEASSSGADGQTIGTEDAVVAGLPGEMGIRECDLVPVPHAVQRGK